MKSIVIYYSYGGNTEKVANILKDYLKCDIFKLEPKIKYTSNYDELVSETNVDSYNIRELKENPDITNYDRIFLLTPTWWYKMAPIVYTFLVQNDFNNKNMYLLMTNAGWPGTVIQDMKYYASKSNAKVIDSLELKFKPYSDELEDNEKLNKWLKNIKGDDNND